MPSNRRSNTTKRNARNDSQAPNTGNRGFRGFEGLSPQMRQAVAELQFGLGITTVEEAVRMCVAEAHLQMFTRYQGTAYYYKEKGDRKFKVYLPDLYAKTFPHLPDDEASG